MNFALEWFIVSKSKKNKSIKISLFPLPEIVLFPGMSLPLHIFEDKYKGMISKCINDKTEFGIVLSKENVCAEVGTTAQIIDVEKLDDDKMNILTEGKERFKILDIVSEKPYLEALVQTYDDIESEMDEEFNEIIKIIKKLSSKALRIFDSISEQSRSKKLKLPKESNELLFLIAANLTCTNDSKQTILESRSINERANLTLNLLKEEIQKLEVMLENKKTKNEVIKNGKLHI